MTTAEAIIIPVLVIVLFAFAVFFFKRRKAYKSKLVDGTLIETTGTIVDLKFDSEGVGFPIIEFVARDGKKYRHPSKSGSNPAPKIGAQKKIYYDPSDPTKSYRSLGAGYLVGGLIALGIALAILIRFLMAHIIVKGGAI